MELEELESLQLSHNWILDLGFFYKKQPSKLKILKLANNNKGFAYEIESIVRIKSLESLDLSGNELKSIFPLSELTGLKELYLSKNRIDDISPIRRLPALQIADLSRNALEDISSLAEVEDPENAVAKRENHIHNHSFPVEAALPGETGPGQE